MDTSLVFSLFFIFCFHLGHTFTAENGLYKSQLVVLPESDYSSSHEYSSFQDDSSEGYSSSNDEDFNSIDSSHENADESSKVHQFDSIFTSSTTSLSNSLTTPTSTETTSSSGKCCGPAPPVKCCDSACQKCLPSLSSAPNNLNSCCRDGICGGACPCQDCVCCYTKTTFVTSTSTCLNLLFSTTISTATQTNIAIFSYFTTVTSSLIFTVTTNFFFTLIDMVTLTDSSTSFTRTSTQVERVTVSTTFYFFTQTITQTGLVVETVSVGTITVGNGTTTVFTEFLPTQLDITSTRGSTTITQTNTVFQSTTTEFTPTLTTTITVRPNAAVRGRNVKSYY